MSGFRVNNLSSDLGNKMQLCIQGYNKRPYGVGMLIAGYDSQGPHIVQTCPSANFYPCKAMAIGARSQSARTYLEKFLDEFAGCELEELVKHGLRALRDTLPNEVELNKEVKPHVLLVAVAHRIETFLLPECDDRDCGQGPQVSLLQRGRAGVVPVVDRGRGEEGRQEGTARGGGGGGSAGRGGGRRGRPAR